MIDRGNRVDSLAGKKGGTRSEKKKKERSTGPTYFLGVAITSYGGIMAATSDRPLEEEETHGNPGETTEGVPGAEAGEGL